MSKNQTTAIFCKPTDTSKHFLLHCLWKRRKVVLELQWFREQRDLCFTPPPTQWMPPPASHQPSKDQSQTPQEYTTPYGKCHPPPARCDVWRWLAAAKFLGLGGQISSSSILPRPLFSAVAFAGVPTFLTLALTERATAFLRGGVLQNSSSSSSKTITSSTGFAWLWNKKETHNSERYRDCHRPINLLATLFYIYGQKFIWAFKTMHLPCCQVIHTGPENKK